MSFAKMSRRGQVVIPQGIREALGLRPGDMLEFLLDARGSATVLAAERIPLRRLKGAWKKAGDPHLSDKDIAAAVMDAARRHRP